MTPTDEYWKGTKWDVCGDRLEALTKSLRRGAERGLPVPNLAVFDKETLKPQEKCIDQSWEKKIMPGGCSKGELTKLGQEQVHSACARDCCELSTCMGMPEACPRQHACS